MNLKPIISVIFSRQLNARFLPLINKLIIATLFLLLVGCTEQNSQPAFPNNAKGKHVQSFSQAKRILKDVYHDNTYSLYCNCRYLQRGKKLIPDLNSCGYQARKNAKRAARIEWEHIMPASYFGQRMSCWQQGGRKNCRRESELFRRMEADLHNLAPAIGEINGDRSNFGFGNIRGEPRRYGQCDMEIDFKKDLAEPPVRVRGDIARVYLYMARKYHISLSKNEQEQFIQWAKRDPVSRWEREKAKRVARFQDGPTPVDKQ
ncbi:endonuclease [Zooshikella sp. RANM57]|uniref:endonuclease n=1 Tax=Zooshikella sp. RANM57 TaxID=3425863 RepID=UPI003D6ED29C